MKQSVFWYYFIIHDGDSKMSEMETISSNCHEPLLAVCSYISNYPLSRFSVQTLQSPQFRHLLIIAQRFTAGVIYGVETTNPSGVPGVRVVPLYLSGKFLII
jgi:hypothetical protein